MSSEEYCYTQMGDTTISNKYNNRSLAPKHALHAPSYVVGLFLEGLVGLARLYNYREMRGVLS